MGVVLFDFSHVGVADGALIGIDDCSCSFKLFLIVLTINSLWFKRESSLAVLLGSKIGRSASMHCFEIILFIFSVIIIFLLTHYWKQ